MTKNGLIEEGVFSADFRESRKAFRSEGRRLGARMHEYPIASPGPGAETLTTDVAILGASEPECAVVVTGGLHGVEGYFGSAVQVGWMRHVGSAPLPPKCAVVLVHAVNPFGFAWRRRVNENNIDLNRNFLLPDQQFAGSPPGYAKLDGLLNPPSPPVDFDLFMLRTLWQILKTGFKKFKSAVAVGQYDFPSGLFFGGSEHAESTKIIQRNLWNWVGEARRVVHLDLHTGLGKHGDHKLLLVETDDSPRMEWYHTHFDAERVEALATSGTAYAAQGTMGAWLSKHCDGMDYRFLAAEFGTYSALRVLRVMRAENRAELYGNRGDASYERAKAAMSECFCPESPIWRAQVLRAGEDLVNCCIASVANGNDTGSS